jgi:hypothetical protein
MTRTDDEAPGTEAIAVPGARSSRWSSAWLVAPVVLIAVAAADLCRPAARQLSARALLAAIHTYQELIPQDSLWLRGRCRFEPTCSAYAAEAVRRYGALRGSYLSIRRVCRCGPWTPLGTRDPVPSARQ